MCLEYARALCIAHHEGMGSVGIGRLVSLALDPVLMPAGFQGGQYGDDGAGDLQIIFCAPHDEFSLRHGHLPPANQQQPDGTCVDLVVDIWADGTLGRLDLEGTSLAETLRGVGLLAHEDAVARVDGRLVAEGLPAIEAALRRLFGNAA